MHFTNSAFRRCGFGIPGFGIPAPHSAFRPVPVLFTNIAALQLLPKLIENIKETNIYLFIF